MKNASTPQDCEYTRGLGSATLAALIRLSNPTPLPLGPQSMAVHWLSRSSQILTCAIALSVSFTGAMRQATAQDSRPVSSSPGRQLAADAYYVIAPELEFGETFEGPVDLPLVTPASDLAWAPPTFPDNRPFYAPASDTLLAMTKSVIFRHPVWGMEFGFKPVRMIAVDIPNADGQVETKLVWYLLYYVRYRGGDLTPNVSKDTFGNDVFSLPQVAQGQSARRFIPGFELNCQALGKTYQSQFIPEAIPLIAEKERVGKPVYDSIAIQKVPVPLTTSRESHPVWGVATWTDVDPRTDFFSIAVRGLTNAQKVSSTAEQLTFQQKTLVLNFSRPGDTINELADRIRYGVPATTDQAQQKVILDKYGLQERLDHYWIYR